MANTLILGMAIEQVQYITAGNIDATYNAMATLGGIVGAQHGARQVLIQNGTDGDVMISDDGVTDKAPVFKGAFILLDVTSNKTNPAGAFYMPAGTVLYVTQLNAAAEDAFAGDYTDPTSGAVFATFFYGK